MKEKFSVTGMTCSACSAHVEKAVSKLDGVKTVAVSLLTNQMQVEFDNEKINGASIIQSVIKSGYNATVFAPQKGGKTVAQAPIKDTAQAEMKRRLVISIGFMLPLFYISMGHMMGLPLPHFMHGTENAIAFALTQLLLCLPIVVVNKKYFTVGFKTLFHGAPNMDSLIAVGSSAALLYGIFAIYRMSWGLGHGEMSVVEHYSMDLYFESAAMILTLITVGKFLETRAKGKTAGAIARLVSLAPQTATILRDGVETEVPIADVAVGDIAVVRPGQRVPVDGVIIEGSGSIDQSALTGESIPIEKNIGDSVTAATINKTGFFKAKTQKIGADTALSKIIGLVEEASSSKAPIAKLADRVSRVFVPAVMAIAVVTFVVWLIAGQTAEFALQTAIAVLVISCPCALGLATPVAIMVGTGRGAENGILIKSAEALETLHTVKTVVLDKTGTITSGKPVVTDILPLNGGTKDALLSLAFALESPSEHPLSEAVCTKARERGCKGRAITDFAAIPGQGVKAVVDGKKCIAGNALLMAKEHIATLGAQDIIDRLSTDGKTPLLFGQEGALIGIIAVADTVKPTSKEAIDGFKALGIEVVMLTGDNAKTAEAVRKSLNIDRAVADVLPDGKEKEIRSIRDKSGKAVLMIGDGINDAPALARADVGMAIGAGTDVAIDAADVVLMKSDLRDGVTAVRLSRAVIRNVRQNLFWAFFYNTVGIPVAAGVLYTAFGIRLSPMLGAAAMSLSSVCVVTNALRLRRFKSQYPKEINIEKEQKTMEKTIKISGMSCPHCSGRVANALNKIDGVSATVSHESGEAIVTLTTPVTDATLRNAITEAGYEVTAIN